MWANELSSLKFVERASSLVMLEIGYLEIGAAGLRSKLPIP